MQAVAVSLPCSAIVAGVTHRQLADGGPVGVSSSLAFVSTASGTRLRQVGGRGCEVALVGGHGKAILRRQQRRQAGRIVAQSAGTTVKWVLEAVGDGTSKHLSEEVAQPGSFELTKETTTVGRSAEKVDVVLDVATVSGLHAKLEKKENVLYVTDLGSTNGTFLSGKKIKAESASPVPPGSLLTFGDEHLAVFKFKTEEAPSTETPADADGTGTVKVSADA